MRVMLVHHVAEHQGQDRRSGDLAEAQQEDEGMSDDMVEPIGVDGGDTALDCGGDAGAGAVEVVGRREGRVWLRIHSCRGFGRYRKQFSTV